MSLMRKFTQMKLHSLPRDTEVWTTRPANVRIEAGQVLLPVAGVYWDSPSTAVPAFGSETMELKNCQLLFCFVCSRSCAAAMCTHVYSNKSALAELRI